MPRDPAGTYTYPPGIEGVPDQTIESADYNSFLHDVQADLNFPRPISVGGTGAVSADGALDNLSAEKFKQVVTNWDTTVWRAGSFYAATTATGTAPVASHAFAGIVYYANATDLIIEATDITDPINPTKWMRVMAAGVWGAWILAPGTTAASGDYTFSTTTTFPPGAGQIRLNNATQNSATEIFISHTTAAGTDNTGPISASIKAGSEIYIQDKDEPAKYKIFTATGSLVLSSGDFRILAQLKSGGTDIVDAQRVLISATNVAVTKKNYIINGAMMVSQENGGTAGTANGYFPVDMFSVFFSNAGTQTSQQWGARTPGGSTYRLRVTATAADASVGAGDWCTLFHAIEGYRSADLLNGIKTITIQFGVKAPAGTYVVSIQNDAQDRSYPATYVIAAGEANTDVIKSVTLPLDATGTWLVNSNAGLNLSWSLMCGTTFQGTANTWQAGNKLGVAGQFNFMGTGGNVFELFDVSLTEGTVAPPFQVPDYASEFAACKRYWERQTVSIYGYQTSGQTLMTVVPLIEKRTMPTCTIVNWVTPTNAAGQAVYTVSTASCTIGVNAVTTGTVGLQGINITADARL